MELAIASLQGVLHRTIELGGGKKDAHASTRELRLIQSAPQILHPEVTVRPQPLAG